MGIQALERAGVGWYLFVILARLRASPAHGRRPSSKRRQRPPDRAVPDLVPPVAVPPGLVIRAPGVAVVVVPGPAALDPGFVAVSAAVLLPGAVVVLSGVAVVPAFVFPNRV